MAVDNDLERHQGLYLVDERGFVFDGGVELYENRIVNLGDDLQALFEEVELMPNAIEAVVEVVADDGLRFVSDGLFDDGGIRRTTWEEAAAAEGGGELTCGCELLHDFAMPQADAWEAFEIL